MASRYIDTANIDTRLTLTKLPTADGAKTTPISDSYVIGDLTSLLEWHCTHKVSREGKCRNKKVQKWQGNRNPFIDFPELVEMIYGDCPNVSAHSAADDEDGDESDVCDGNNDDEDCKGFG
jgi:hypothetical protein